MTATRESENTWSVTINGVCYIKATKADGTVEEKTFPFSGGCSGISTTYLDSFNVNVANNLCKSQLNNFNQGRTAGNLGIPYGTDYTVLCNDMK